MTNTNETIADIIAEMRKISAEKYRLSSENGGAYGNPGVYYLDFAQFARVISDRLEAAWKREKAAIEADALVVGGLVEASRNREVFTKTRETDNSGAPIYTDDNSGNRAKTRKALLFIKQYFDKIDPFNINTYTFAQIEVESIEAAISAALAAPSRNCDVGTAEDQAERFGRYCDKFTQDGMHCETCPCCGKIKFGRCEFAWAQMPYEKGGSK